MYDFDNKYSHLNIHVVQVGLMMKKADLLLIYNKRIV